MTKLPALLSYGEEVYRPAGYRIPMKGEYYVARDGHIKCNMPKIDNNPKIPVLIVRLLNMEEDFKGR